MLHLTFIIWLYQVSIIYTNLSLKHHIACLLQRDCPNEGKTHIKGDVPLGKGRG
jgi:hypothetical protein